MEYLSWTRKETNQGTEQVHIIGVIRPRYDVDNSNGGTNHTVGTIL